jgi:methyl-accepting chemotaxis protein
VARTAALDGTASRWTRDQGFFADHGLWAPSVRLFRRLGLGSKATLASLCFLVPLVLVMTVWLRAVRAVQPQAGP